MDTTTAGRLVKLAALIITAYFANRYVRRRPLTAAAIIGAPRAALRDLAQELGRFFGRR